MFPNSSSFSEVQFEMTFDSNFLYKSFSIAIMILSAKSFLFGSEINPFTPSVIYSLKEPTFEAIAVLPKAKVVLNTPLCVASL